MNKHHQVAFRGILRGVAEQLPDQRDIAEQRHFGDRLFGHIFHQAAEHHRLATVDHHFVINRARVEGWAEAGIFRCAVVDAGYFLLNLQVDHVAIVDLRHNLQLGPHGFTLNRVKDVVAAGGLRTGKHRHILTDVERRFFIIQRDHAWRGEDVVFTVGGERGHQRTEITVKEAGRKAREARPFHGAIFNLADWQAGSAKLHAAVLAGPLHAKIQAVAVLHFGNDRFHQHLRTANIQLVDHLLQGVHHVRLRGDHQGVGRLVGGNVQVG